MKTVQLTEAEIDALRAAAVQRIAALSRASAYAETVAECSDLQMLGVILESAVEALGRAE